MLLQPPRAPFAAVNPVHQGVRLNFMSEGQRRNITQADNCHFAHSATSTTEAYPGAYEVGGACLCYNELCQRVIF